VSFNLEDLLDSCCERTRKMLSASLHFHANQLQLFLCIVEEFVGSLVANVSVDAFSFSGY